MPDVVINELSVIGQAASPIAVDDLMRGLARALRAVIQASGRGNSGTAYKHHDLANRHLYRGASEITIHNWLNGPFDRDLLAIRQFLTKILNKGPYLDLLIPDVHVCYHIFQGESTEHPFSGLAGAAHFRMALLSFANCPRFPRGLVSVRYGSSEHDAVAGDLQHFLDDSDVNQARRKYEPHKKHTGGPMHGARGTPMDLSDDDAQAALDQCVSVLGEKRVYSRFRGKVYVFLPHRAEENRYHGFPVDESEAFQKMPTLYKLLPPEN